jgi:hypothetical protein
MAQILLVVLAKLMIQAQTNFSNVSTKGSRGREADLHEKPVKV